jgi:hypothetical protein
MALPLIIAAFWILVLSLVLAACVSARQGDLQQLKDASTHTTSDTIEPPASSPRIAAQPGTRVYPCNPAVLS